MNIQLTEQEARVAVELLNLAVKANGLVVAESALYLTKKLQTAIAANQIKQDESTDNGKGKVD